MACNINKIVILEMLASRKCLFIARIYRSVTKKVKIDEKKRSSSEIFMQN